MTQRLLFRINPHGDRLTWLSQDGNGRVAAGSSNGLPAPAQLSAAREIVVLVPAEDVLLLETRVPAKSRAQLAKAVPFALEEQLAAAVETLHFGLPERSGGESVMVSVVARARVQAWLKFLAEQGIRPDIMLPESLALPLTQGRGSAVLEDGRAIVRLGKARAFVANVAQLGDWLQLAQGQAAAKPEIDFYDFRAAAASAKSATGETPPKALHDPLRFFAKHLSLAGAPNLLCGEFAPEHRGDSARRWWRVAAMLAAASVVTAFAGAKIEQYKLQRDSAALEDAILQRFKAAMPEITRIEDPEWQLKSELERLRSGSGSSPMLALLAKISPVLGQSTRFTLQGMEYRNGTFELALRAPDVPVLDGLREGLATLPGIRAEVTAANPVDGGVDGRVRVTGSAP